MTAERDNPRGPTATELRSRALAHVEQMAHAETVPDYPDLARGALRCNYCGALSPQGCTASPCSFHGS